MNKLLIIDGHNFLFRGYYGVPLTATLKDGTQVNALYGFFAILRKYIELLNPTHILVVFDTETGTNSKIAQIKNYKANRVSDYGTVFTQLTYIKKCLALQNIKYVESTEYEADDLIGSYASLFKNNYGTVLIGSNDHDFMQLVNEKTIVVRGYHGTVSHFNSKTVKKVFGVCPQDYLTYLALKGDVTDNIKGIQWIGAKRASYLVNKFKTIENLYKNFDKLQPLYKRLLHNKKEFLLNLVNFFRIRTDLADILSLDSISAKKIEIVDKMGDFIKAHRQQIICKV